MKKPYLSIIIPSYNEARNIGRGVLDDILNYLRTRTYDWEVIFSDDGSSDSTLPHLQEFIKIAEKEFPGRFTLLENPHAGKGPTVQSGMLAARGVWRLFTDFDQSTPLSEVEKLLTAADEGYEIVIGSREIHGAKRDKEPLHRHLMGRGFNLLVQTLAVPGIKDTQCGFKLFSSEATEKLFSQLVIYGRKEVRSDAFTGAFDVEVLFLARKSGYKIKEVAVHWAHNSTNRVSPVKDSLRMLRDILRVRLVDLKHQYNHAQ